MLAWCQGTTLGIDVMTESLVPETALYKTSGRMDNWKIVHMRRAREAAKKGRVKRFTVLLKKDDGAKLGISAKRDQTMAVIRVSKVNGGCVGDYNRIAPRGKKIQEGDMIVMVNKVSLDAATILELTIEREVVARAKPPKQAGIHGPRGPAQLESLREALREALGEAAAAAGLVGEASSQGERPGSREKAGRPPGTPTSSTAPDAAEARSASASERSGPSLSCSLRGSRRGSRSGSEKALGAEPTPSSFFAYMERRPGERFGMDAAPDSRGLRVTGIKEGCVHNYNLTAEHGRLIVVGDVIAAVNKESGDSDVIRAAISKGSRLEVVVLRGAG